MLHDARDPELLVQDLDGGTHFNVLRLGKIIVNQAVVGTLERSALQIVKWLQRLEAREVDAINNFQVLRGRKLPDYRGDRFHMLQFRQHATDFDGHGSIAHACHKRGVGRLHDHIGADSGLPLPRIIQHSYRQSHDQQDQRHFHRYGNNADQRPDRSMHQVGNDHFVHHGFGWCLAYGCRSEHSAIST